jgi:hypothetical protein
MKVLLVFMLLLTTGCAQYMWVREDGRRDQSAIDQFRKDSYECERDVRQSGYYGQGLYGAIEAQGFGERCLRAKGYQKIPADATMVRVN